MMAPQVQQEIAATTVFVAVHQFHHNMRLRLPETIVLISSAAEYPTKRNLFREHYCGYREILRKERPEEASVP